MSKFKSMEDIYTQITKIDDVSFISVIGTGIIFKILPDTSWDNMQAFLGVVAIYMAVFSCVYFAKFKIRQRRESHYHTVRMRKEDAC